jgi:dsRNA-specific ribonuclease
MEISCNSIDEINLIQFCNENEISPPKYEVKKIDDKYLSIVTIDGGLSAEGSANTETEALESSAKSLLFKLKNEPTNVEQITQKFKQISMDGNKTDGKSTGVSKETSHNSSAPKTKVIDNPIGYLQEYCVEKGYSLPKYGEPVKSGYDHTPTFASDCKVVIDDKEIIGEGKGSNKKECKKAAAEDVIKQMSEKNLI